VYCLAPNGTLRWAYQTLAMIWSSAAIGPDGTVYVGSSDYNLYSLAGDTGALLWKRHTPGGGVHSSPALGPGHVLYHGCNDFNVYALDSRWASCCRLCNERVSKAVCRGFAGDRTLNRYTSRYWPLGLHGGPLGAHEPATAAALAVSGLCVHLLLVLLPLSWRFALHQRLQQSLSVAYVPPWDIVVST
jgi:hypothetical protein